MDGGIHAVLKACINDVVNLTVYSQSDGVDCLHAAVSKQLKTVVESLCQRGASLDARDSSSEPAIWHALSIGAYEVADVLVGLLILAVIAAAALVLLSSLCYQPH